MYRDIILKRQARDNQKQDRLPFRRAVLTDQYGNQTSTNPMDDVWSSLSEKRVWYMIDGGVTPAQILCRKVSDPYVGLGVIVGYADNSQQIEVLSDDFFLTQSGDATGWASTSPRDLEPGGLKQMWVYTKVITPIMTYPGAGLTVNVTSGDYVYNGVRVTFNGYIEFPLDAPTTPGEHYFAGLYLDNANSLQIVYGASVSTAVDPPEPAWPDGAFQLSVALIEEGQSTIDFDADIFDRRMAWADTVSSSPSAWPRIGKVNIGTAEYATLAPAAVAAAGGDLFKLGEGSFPVTTDLALSASDFYFIGSGLDVSIVEMGAGGVLSLGAGVLHDLSVNQTENNSTALTIGAIGSAIIYDCAITANGTGTMVAIETQDNTTLADCFLSATGATTNYGIKVTGGVTTVYGGEIIGDVFIDTSCTLRLEGTKWDGSRAGAGVLAGWWDDGNGRIKSRYFRHFQLMGA